MRKALLRGTLTVLVFFSNVIHLSGPSVNTQSLASSALYSKATLKRLRHTADSLNKSYSTLSPPPTTYSRLAARADFIEISDEQVLPALNDIRANVSFDSFIKKYQNISWERNVLVLRDTNTNLEGRRQLEYVGVEIAGSYGHRLQYPFSEKQLNAPLSGQWRYNYCPSGNGSTAFIEAFYFQTEFQKQVLPTKYVRYLQYADFIIGSPDSQYRQRELYVPYMFRPGLFPHIAQLNDYIEKETHKPRKEFSDAWLVWRHERPKLVDSLLSGRPQFVTLLQSAAVEALIKGGSNDELEDYAGKYLSLQVKLQLMSQRKVLGYCSRDQIPSIHLINIAQLAAQLHNWPVFIRAQMDVLNDRVERMSDASFGALRRQTYVAELEALGLNVPDLFIGIALRIERAGPAHYYGNISRLGRAISESSYSEEVEQRLLEMMQDNTLDDYNRILMYFLYQGSINYTSDSVSKFKKIARLKVALKGMPQYIAAKINLEP